MRNNDIFILGFCSKARFTSSRWDEFQQTILRYELWVLFNTNILCKWVGEPAHRRIRFGVNRYSVVWPKDTGSVQHWMPSYTHTQREVLMDYQYDWCIQNSQVWVMRTPTNCIKLVPQDKTYEFVRDIPDRVSYVSLDAYETDLETFLKNTWETTPWER